MLQSKGQEVQELIRNFNHEKEQLEILRAQKSGEVEELKRALEELKIQKEAEARVSRILMEKRK